MGVDTETEVVGQGENQAPVEQDFEKQKADLHADQYDTKSPQLGGGTFDEDEESPIDWSDTSDDDDGAETEVDDVEEAEEPETPAPKTYKKLSVNGAEYNLGSEEELEALARRGVEFGNIEARLQPYSQVIDAVENDPKLGQVIADAITAYRTGVPLQRPAPDAAPVDPNAEPEQGDYEDYDDYEKRLVKWREDKQQALIDYKIKSHFQNMQQQAHVQRIQAANTQIINYVNADPEKDSVLSVVTGPNFPAGLREAMDRDGPTFMSVYDDIRRQQGKQPYFGAPPLGGQAAPQKGSQALKGSPTPFTESARGGNQQTGKVGGAEKLPDFKNMSDDSFRKWKEGFMLGRPGM